MTYAPFSRLIWRLFFTHLGIGLLVLLLGSGALSFLIRQEITAFHRREVAYLSASVSRPDLPLSVPGEPPRAYLLHSGAADALLVDRPTLDMIRNGDQIPELFRLPDEMRPVVPMPGERVGPPPVFRIPPGDTEQYLIAALRDLPAEEVARLVVIGRQVARPRSGPANSTVIFVPLPERPPINGVLVVAIRPGIVDVLRHDVQTWLWVAAGAVLVLAALLAWIVARGISGPLRELGRVAALASKGDLSQRVPGCTGEIGVVVRIFNQALDQMAEAQAKYQQVEQSRRDLVASVSHEFRAPLASLRGYLELIRDGVIHPEEQGRYVVVMLEDALRLNRLVEDLLDLARIQARQVSLQLVRLDPAESVHRVVEQASWKVGSGTTLVAEPRPGLPAVVADRDRLDQVLTNLVENALRYAGSGGWIRVTAEDSGGQVVFSVNDSGPGIAPEEQPRVWERFYKVERARTPGGGGTGLGLAIVKELVEAMGGQVGLISTPGRGSRFWFTIPSVGPEATSQT